MARKLRNGCLYETCHIEKKKKKTYLFRAVSTALMSTAPLVPGSLAYSSLGAGAGGGGGRAFARFASTSPDLGNAGTSSDRRD